MKTRNESVATAQALLAKGLTRREIALAMNRNYRTVISWLSDPDGSLAQARAASYSHSCEKCGEPTSGSRGPKRTPKICDKCRKARQHNERRELVISEIQTWAAAHNGRAPTNRDIQRGGTAFRYFGSWVAAVEAAGLTPTRSSPRDNKQSEVLLVRLENGTTIRQLAEYYKCWRNAINNRINRAREQRDAQNTESP